MMRAALNLSCSCASAYLALAGHLATSYTQPSQCAVTTTSCQLLPWKPNIFTQWLLHFMVHLQLKQPVCEVMGVADAEVRHDRMPNPINPAQFRLYNGLSAVPTVYVEVRGGALGRMVAWGAWLATALMQAGMCLVVCYTACRCLSLQSGSAAQPTGLNTYIPWAACQLISHLSTTHHDNPSSHTSHPHPIMPHTFPLPG